MAESVITPAVNNDSTGTAGSPQARMGCGATQARRRTMVLLFASVDRDLRVRVVEMDAPFCNIAVRAGGVPPSAARLIKALTNHANVKDVA